MAGPARAGVVVYASDLERSARFYERVVGMRRVHADADRIVLTSDDADLVIHVPAGPVQADAAPQLGAAFKPFFTVADLGLARDDVIVAGGHVLPGHWPGAGFTVCNVCDPEGNILQLRAFN